MTSILPSMYKKIKIPLLVIGLLMLIPLPIKAYEFPINSCPVETDLFEHVSSEIDNRIEDVTANDSTKKLFTTRGNLTSPWVRNPDVWTDNATSIDFTGMSPWNSRGGYTRAGTLISPRHIALANHYTLSIGDTVLFVTSDNKVVTRTVSAVQRVLTTDISIAKLNSDVPETVTFYPILDKSDFETYLSDGYNMANWNLPVVMFDQEDKALIQDTAKLYPSYDEDIPHDQSASLDREGFYEEIIGGDSGNPGFVLINGKPVLLLTHFGSNTGPSYSYYKQDIQDVINTMGAEYELSTIDLSCFNAPIVLDESVLSTIENSTEGATVGNVDIKYNIEEDTPYFSILSGNSDGAISINSTTGAITVASSTLIDSPHFPRNVEVAVEEGTVGGRMSKKTYTINLATYPYFNVQNYSFAINEHSANNTLIGTVQALDAQSNTLEYSITSGNGNGIFTINSSTGAISVAGSTLLNYETNSSHELVITATESSTLEELSVTIDVTILLNDISYTFSQSSYTFEIDELDENDTVVGSINSTIVDSLNVASTYYQIISGNTDGIFSINSSTGQITIVDNSLLNGNQIYNLVIGASEESNSAVLKSVPATINVTKTDRPTLSYQAQTTSLVKYQIEEGSNVSMVFELSGAYTKTVEAHLVQTSGSATIGSDYALSTDIITFLPGETSKTVILTALTDSSSENDETVLLSIVDNTRVSFGPRQNATITIKNKAPVSSGGGGGGGGSPKKKVVVPETVTPQAPTSQTPPLSQSTPNSPSVNTSPTTSSFTRNLELGSTGEDVKKLQELLISKGYILSAGATGYFGPQTQGVLIKYQQDNNIVPAIGYFGPRTQESLVQQIIPVQNIVVNPPSNMPAPVSNTSPVIPSFTRNLELGSTGEDVKKLQELLISKGYTLPAGATGYFGPQTQGILIKYQQDNNIVPAIGYFGPKTKIFLTK